MSGQKGQLHGRDDSLGSSFRRSGKARNIPRQRRKCDELARRLEESAWTCQAGKQDIAVSGRQCYQSEASGDRTEGGEALNRCVEFTLGIQYGLLHVLYEVQSTYFVHTSYCMCILFTLIHHCNTFRLGDSSSFIACFPRLTVSHRNSFYSMSSILYVHVL